MALLLSFPFFPFFISEKNCITNEEERTKLQNRQERVVQRRLVKEGLHRQCTEVKILKWKLGAFKGTTRRDVLCLKPSALLGDRVLWLPHVNAQWCHHSQIPYNTHAGNEQKAVLTAKGWFRDQVILPGLFGCDGGSGDGFPAGSLLRLGRWLRWCPQLQFLQIILLLTPESLCKFLLPFSFCLASLRFSPYTWSKKRSS